MIDRAFIRSGGSHSGSALELLHELEAKEKVMEAALRLLGQYPYLAWFVAGGPDQCRHGYAAGVPCPACDQVTVNEAIKRMIS